MAKSIVSECEKGQIESVYSHENFQSIGQLRFNCYGFMEYLLKQACSDSYEEVNQFMYDNKDQIPISIDKIPCPFHYAAFFSSLTNCKNKYWDCFQNFKDVKQGDIIIYLPCNYTPKEISKIQSGRTGMHIMIVEQVLKQEEDRVELMIIDCTRFPHCKEDSRTKGGIGHAPLTIYSQENCTVLQWGTRKEKWEKDLFFGRLKE